MCHEIRENKAALRQKIRAFIQGLSGTARAEASQAACKILSLQPSWRAAQSVMFYAPLLDEIDLWPLAEDALRYGKLVTLPRYVVESGQYEARQIRDLNGDVQPGRFGVREPVSRCSQIAINRLDLVLVPGVAFDLHGRRLGRGKGFYDQLLAPVCGTRCGVGFDEQIVPEIPVEPHDVLVNCILTPTRWCAVGPRAVLE